MSCVCAPTERVKMTEIIVVDGWLCGGIVLCKTRYQVATSLELEEYEYDRVW